MKYSPEHLKPDFADCQKRMDAYWQGEVWQRPPLLAACRKKNYTFLPESTYHDRAVDGDLTQILQDMLHNAKGTLYLGEAVPAAWMSFGTHEIASLFGAKIRWTDSSGDTTWVEPIVSDWAEHLPLRFDEGNPIWQRLRDFYVKSVEVFQGQMLAFPIDFHSNMDLLLSLRGDEQLCYDLYDCPELIDRAMEGARETFARIWNAITSLGKMDETGYWFDAYSRTSTCTLACDYICMISDEMARRWFVPTIEYEASLVDHVTFHWDGPGALRHYDIIMGIDKIHTIAYMPNPSELHRDYLELYEKIQKQGKSIAYSGTPDEIRSVFHRLDPAKTLYKAQISNAEEFYALDEWMRRQM